MLLSDFCHRRSILLKKCYELKTFDSQMIIHAFTEELGIKVTTRITRAVWRVLKEFVEYGYLDINDGQYSLKRS
jgi:hypothetical protein